jgi:hypothetical protein
MGQRAVGALARAERTKRSRERSAEGFETEDVES